MAGDPGIHILSDVRWAELEPRINEVRPPCKVPHENLRQTIEAILWRHQNGARWRSVPTELGPWWKAAQTFIRWAHLGVWERLLDLVQQRGLALGMTFLDGTHVRAPKKAGGAKKGGPTAGSATAVKRLAVLVAATAPRPACSPTAVVAPSPSPSRRARRTSCRWHRGCWTARPTCPAGWWAPVAWPPTDRKSTRLN